MNNKFRKLHLNILCLLFALFVALYAVGSVFAWFSSQNWNLGIKGQTAGAYFAYGNGEKDKKDSKGNIITNGDLSDWNRSTGPFGITLPKHMYNLATLQDSGRFGTTDKYYFELGDNVDMYDGDKNYVLPPIGNVEFPFNGEFNGNGYTIKNLVVSTNKAELIGRPAASDYVFSNSVGFFGMTTEDSYIGNFILENPVVEVSNVNTKYDTTTETDIDEYSAAGLAVGYVNGTVHSIGVKGGTLAVRRINYSTSTFNSILGNLSPNARQNNNLSGDGIGGSGNKFGSDFDAEGIVARLQKIAGNGGLAHRLPNVTPKNGGYGIAQLEKLPFTVTSDSTYEGKTAAEVVSPRNIGYILGNENATHSNTVEFGGPLYRASNNDYYLADENGVSTGVKPDANEDFPIPKWFYEPKTQWGNYYNTGAFTALSQERMQEIYDEAPEMMEYIFGANKDGTYTFDSIQLGGNFSNNGVIQMYANDSNSKNSGAWSPHGMIEWGTDKDDPTKAGKYGQAYERNGYAADENGNYYVGKNGQLPDGQWGWVLTDETTPNIVSGKSVPIDAYEGGIALPNNGIWFRPANTGKIRMAFYTDVEGGGGGFQILKLQRPNIDEDNPFSVNWSNGRHSGSGDIKTIEYNNYVIARNILFYLEIDVQEPDLKAGYEYWICNSQGSKEGAKFVYLDIGASGAVDDGAFPDRADKSKQVTAVDFIYDGVTIAQEDIPLTEDDAIPSGSFVKNSASYIPTSTMLVFSGNGTIVCFYYRKDEQAANTYPTIHAAYSLTSTLVLTESIGNRAVITTTDRTVTVNGNLNPSSSPWRP